MKKQLKISSLSKKFKKSNTYVNDDINLIFNPGEISAIIGSNGAGKTTILNQIIGLTKPSKGSITYDRISFITNSRLAREYVSMMPQLHAPITGVTMSQSVESILRIKGLRRKEAKKECTKLLKELKIDEWADTPGQKLSGGIRRLTSFAMVVASPSSIIILDEPTNDVDPFRRQIIWKYLKKLSNNGHTIIIVTHNILEVEKYADRYILIHEGKVVEDKKLDKKILRLNNYHFMIVNFMSLKDLKNVELPNVTAVKTNYDEMMIELKLADNQMTDTIDWVLELVFKKKIHNYSISQKPLNEVYGEVNNGNNEHTC